MVELAASGQGSGAGSAGAGATSRPPPRQKFRLRRAGRSRPPRRRRQLGRPRGRLAVYFSRSTSGLRKPPSSGDCNYVKGCATKNSIKLRAHQNKNKARARQAIHLSNSGGPPGEPELIIIKKLRQPLPSTKAAGGHLIFISCRSSDARKFKRPRAQPKISRTHINMRIRHRRVQPNQAENLKESCISLKVHLYRKSYKQKWFT